MTKIFVNKIPGRSHVFEHCNILEKSDSCQVGTIWGKTTAITTKLSKTAIKISGLHLGKKGEQIPLGSFIANGFLPSCLGGI